MSEQIVIKYKEEYLNKEDMTEREKAIWDDGYRNGYSDHKKERDNLPLFISILIIALVLITSLLK